MKKVSWVAAAGPVMALLLFANVATAQWTTAFQAGPRRSVAGRSMA